MRVDAKADTSRNDAKQFSEDQDYIYVYSRQPEWKLNRLPRSSAQNSIYSSPDGDPVPWLAKPGHAPGASTHQGMVYGIQSPFTGEILYPPVGGCWRLGQENNFESLSQWARYKLVDIHDEEKRAEVCGVSVSEVREGVLSIVLDEPLETAKASALKRQQSVWPDVYFINGGSLIQVKGHLPTGGIVPRTIWDYKVAGSNRNSKAEVKALFPGKEPFSTPKPERLLERIIHIGTNPGDIVLDCFAGSGTTAAVAQKMGRRWVTCELLESTFETFTKPRLKKVVNDEDPGGITMNKPERVAAEGVELPDGVTPDDAAKFTSVLNKLIADRPDLKNDKTVKALKKFAKTRNSKGVVNWRGGGGFRTAHLAPACFDYDNELERVVLTEHATGELLVKSVAANLGYVILPDNERGAFDACRGKTMLKVFEGLAGPELVDALVAQLADGESLVIAATGVLDGTREYLRKARRGSQIVHVPDGVFPYTKEVEL